MHEDDIKDAVRALADADFCASSRYQEQQWRANRHGAHVDILDFERLFIRKARKLHIPVFAHCVMRTPEEQIRLHKEGRTKVLPPDATHVHGFAVDLIHGIKAWNMNHAEWQLMGHIGHECAKSLGIKLQWGGDWKFFDPAHWELDDWRHYRE